MTNENKNDDNKAGTETDSNSKTDMENVKTDREALKAENDAYEAEMLRAEQLRATKQKGGKSSAGQKQTTPEEELQKQAEEEAKEIVDAFR
jgi:hypothetical protein